MVELENAIEHQIHDFIDEGLSAVELFSNYPPRDIETPVNCKYHILRKSQQEKKNSHHLRD